MESANKSRKGYQIYLCLELFIMVLVGIFWTTKYVMELSNLFYRTWLEITGQILTYYVLPCLILGQIILIAMHFIKVSRSAWIKGIWYIVSAICGLLCAADLVLGGFLFLMFYDSAFERENQINPTFLDCTTQEFLGAIDDKRHVYYEPCYYIMKKKIDNKPLIIENMLENQYHKQFEVLDDSPKENYYNVIRTDDPSIQFRAMLSFSYNECLDDYDVYFAKQILKRMIDNKEIDRDYIVKEEYYSDNDLKDTILFSCKGEYDMEDLKEDIGKFANHLLEDKELQEHLWNVKIGVRCEEKINGTWWYLKREFNSLSIGNKYSWGYLDSESLKKQIYQNVEFYYKNQASFDKIELENELDSNSQTEELEETEEEETNGNSNSVDYPEYATESDVTTPEGAYQVLYHAIFEKQGKENSTNYNAKGNFYATLADGIEMVDGETMNIVETVVYNGLSENGKCQIFVQYQEYYYSSGESGNSKIIDFYAVDMETKKVVRADKHGWDELGCKEYQEMTN